MLLVSNDKSAFYASKTSEHLHPELARQVPPGSVYLMPTMAAAVEHIESTDQALRSAAEAALRAHEDVLLAGLNGVAESLEVDNEGAPFLLASIDEINDTTLVAADPADDSTAWLSVVADVALTGLGTDERGAHVARRSGQADIDATVDLATGALEFEYARLSLWD